MQLARTGSLEEWMAWVSRVKDAIAITGYEPT